MSDWVRVAALAELPEGGAIERVAGEQLVALYRVEGQVWALDGVCPHQGGPLGCGELRGHVVTCPWHGWQFDVRTGQHQTSAAMRQPTFDVRVEDGEIYVRPASR